MTEWWFKVVGIECEDRFGFGTVDEAVQWGTDCAPRIIGDAKAQELGLIGCENLFRIRNALAIILAEPRWTKCRA